MPQIILLRHGDKAQTRPDPALSELGKSQAVRLADWVKSEKLPKPSVLLCSPTRRARETLEPLANSLGLSIQSDDRLSERQNDESEKDFGQRILALCKEVAGQSSCVFLVSHYDWLLEAVLLLSTEPTMSSKTQWAPAEFCHFHVRDEVWHLTQGGRV